MTEYARNATFVPSIYYKDPLAALDWLEKAFGFERTLLVIGSDPNFLHAEMSFGNGYFIVGGAWVDAAKPPSALGGASTQSTCVRLESGIDEHFKQAKATGAQVIQDLMDQPYGDRTYRAADPEGHVWTFFQTIQHVSRADYETATGMKAEGWT